MVDNGNLRRAELYQLIRSQIEHEDELVNLRVVWQLLVQSFFFSAYAALLTAKEPAKNPAFENLQQLLIWLIPVVALCAGLLTFISTFTALRSIRYLRQLYENYDQRVQERDPSAKLFPAIQGPSRGSSSVCPTCAT